MSADAPPDARRRRLRPEVRRRQVLDAAVAVFSEQGFHDASMDDVAARAGVSKPSVYAHGGTKEELFRACLRREGERLLRSVSAAVTSGDAEVVGGGRVVEGAAPDPDGGRERLARGVRAFFVAVTTRRQGWSVLYRQAATGQFADEVAALRGEVVVRAALLLAGGLGRPVDEVVPVAHAVVGAAEGLADWWLGRAPDPAAPDPTAADVLADHLVTLVWPGLDALRAGPEAGGAIPPSTPVSPSP